MLSNKSRKIYFLNNSVTLKYIFCKFIIVTKDYLQSCNYTFPITSSIEIVYIVLAGNKSQPFASDKRSIVHADYYKQDLA